MTDTSREAVEALIAEAEEFTNPTVGYAFASDHDHNQTVPLLDSLRQTLAALLDERDAARDASVWRDTIDEQRAYIRDLEAENRKLAAKLDRKRLIHVLWDQVPEDWDENDIGILVDAILADTNEGSER
jgi:hypothetical protein